MAIQLPLCEANTSVALPQLTEKQFYLKVPRIAPDITLSVSRVRIRAVNLNFIQLPDR